MSSLTIESLAVELMKAGQSPKEALVKVRRVFPQAQTSIKCMYHYSSKHKLNLTRAHEINREALADVYAEIYNEVESTGTDGK